MTWLSMTKVPGGSVPGRALLLDRSRPPRVSEWVCDRLTTGQVAMLAGYTQRHLRIVNDVEHRSVVPPLLGRS